MLATRFFFYQFLTALLFFFSSRFVWAEAVVFSQDHELIMSISLMDGTPVSNEMIVYRVDNQWYLPFRELTESLDLDITVSPALGRAEGDFLSATYHFKLDKAACRVEVARQVWPYDCDLIVIQDEEMYIEQSLLETWFPMIFRIDTHASSIAIESPIKFGPRTRREREKTAAIVHGKILGQKPSGFYLQPVERKKFEGPILQQQLTGVHDSKAGQSLRHDTAAALELLGFETKAVLGGDEKKIENWSLNFSKKDPDGDVVTGLKVREIQAFDFELPSVPLIWNSTRSRGLIVSSFPISQPNNFISRDFRGPLPAGWEVELYQNDLLVSRDATDSSTEYSFQNVQLVYGLNRFRLVFYGPQGQRREEIEIVNVGQSLLKPGELNYRAALAEQYDSGDDLRSLFQLQYGANSRWTIGTSYLESEKIKYGMLTVNGSYSQLLVSLNAAANSESGTATEEALQIPFERGSIGISQAQVHKFESDVMESEGGVFLQRLTKLNGSWSFAMFPTVRLGAEVARKDYLETSSTVVSQRTSWQTPSTFWFNTLSYDSGSESHYSGQFSTLTNYSEYELRPQIDYAEIIKSFSFGVLARVTDQFNYETILRSSFEKKLHELQVTWNRIFKKFTLSALASGTTDHTYRVQALLSYSLIPLPQKGSGELSPFAQVDFGAAQVHVFLDLDQNGVFSPGDKPLPSVLVLINQNDTNMRTDSEGQVLLSRLPVHQYVDLSLSLISLPDPLYKPAQKGLRIVPRPGHVFQIPFPVIIRSEIDGVIQLESSRGLRGKAGLEVQLLNDQNEVIKTAKTAADGYYLIQELSAGDYILRIDPTQLKQMGLHSRPELRKIQVPALGLVEGPFDFTLEKVQPR